MLAEDLRLQRLAEDLLLLTRADEHSLALHRRPVDLDELVFDEARRLREATGLRRVLRNLGDNAACHAHGRLAFSLAERDGLVLLGVDDDGPGIPEADRARVLERFMRLDDAWARDDGGGGLGLAIVAELAAAHGAASPWPPAPWMGPRLRSACPGWPTCAAERAFSGVQPPPGAPGHAGRDPPHHPWRMYECSAAPDGPSPPAWPWL